MAQRNEHQPKILPTQTAHAWGDDPRGYFTLTTKPLHILVFLLPVILYYEIGLLGWIGIQSTSSTLEAHQLLSRFFQVFGVFGLHLPALALVLTLLLQHFFNRDPLRIKPMFLLAMIAESAFLTGPLIILSMVLSPTAGTAEPVAALQAAATDPGIQVFTADFQHRLMIAIGAGLYEEMLFRLVLITMLHFLITDVLGFKDRLGKMAAVFGAALAFTLIHDQIRMATGELNLRLAMFILISGIYLGTLFLVRGFGLAVGVHLMWDLLAVVILPGFRGD